MSTTQANCSFTNKIGIQLAIVTGEHPYDVLALDALCEQLDGIKCYVQHMDEYLYDSAGARTQYDVVLFYNFHQHTPPAGETGWFQRGKTQLLRELRETGQGIVVLHHALLAYPGWRFWSELVGIPHEERYYTLDQVPPPGVAFDQEVRYTITKPAHVITAGLSAWTMRSETWSFGPTRCAADCQVLIKAEHDKMRLQTACWTHRFGASRVFCLQPGHGPNDFGDLTFRTLLWRGILWSVDRL